MIAKNKLYIKSPPPSTYSYSQKIFHFFLKKHLKKERDLFHLFSPTEKSKENGNHGVGSHNLCFFLLLNFLFGIKKINLYKMYTIKKKRKKHPYEGKSLLKL